MSRPEDIPEDVWEAAGQTVALMPDRPPFKIDVQGAIARAILAERERCAKIVEDYPPEGFFDVLYSRTTRADELDPFGKFEGDAGQWAAFMGIVLRPYAAAIRKGSHQ